MWQCWFVRSSKCPWILHVHMVQDRYVGSRYVRTHTHTCTDKDRDRRSLVEDLMELQVCDFHAHSYIFHVHLRIFHVDIRIFHVYIYIFNVDICIFHLYVYIFSVDICIMFKYAVHIVDGHACLMFMYWEGMHSCICALLSDYVHLCVCVHMRTV